MWQEIILAEDNLDEFTIDDGKVVYQSVTLNDLLELSKVEWKAVIELERVKRKERRKAQEEEQKLATERAAKQREEAEKARSEAEGRKLIEEQERIEAERRFADSLLERMKQQEEQVRDSQGRRWVKCEFCGKIALESKFSSYGGVNRINLGICHECQKNNPEARIIRMPEPVKKAAKIVVNKCPDCGGDLKEKMGKYGRFVGCNNYPNCRYIRSIK